MMNTYFNIKLEFDKHKIFNTIEQTIVSESKGYVCVVDGNVLATANKDKEYQKIINGGLVNICDGSSIALLASIIYKQRYFTYTGPDVFEKYVKMNYKQYFIGNTSENLSLLKKRFIELGYDIEKYIFEPLPFKDVDDFDYQLIADNINSFSPDIIWVSLGAPKQEIFISKIYPYINKGILFAIGAAFNLYLGNKKNKRAPYILRKLSLEWFFRVIQEPKRVGIRALNYFIILPGLILEEIKQSKKKNVL